MNHVLPNNCKSASNSFGDLTGLRAVVTGSSSGIGRAIAREFAKAGADIVVHAHRSQDQAEELSAEIRSLGRRSVVVLGDVAETSELAKMCQAAWTAFDGVDIWVNNAGVDLLTGPAKDWDYQTKLQRLLDIDVRGTALISHDIGQRMKMAGRGVLLNIGWDQADRGMEGASGELFATAKNAVMGFTRSLAASLAPEVRVNCIAPGWIKTAWGEKASDVWQDRVLRETPLRRWGLPEDIAKLARFLVSPDASYLTGQIVNANGGAIR
ncbi:MAG: fabG 2 [Planctomycetaceae bacterium]|nr:fabG 2 [Planctomycetaceae bacterium]